MAQEVIMYHYVKDSWHSDKHYYLKTADFERQLQYFQNNGGIISLEEYIDGKDGYHLSFDDGLKDHIKFVLPLLEKYDAKASFYISTSPLQNKKLLGVHRTHILLFSVEHGELWSEIQKLLEGYELSEEQSNLYTKQELSSYEYNIKRVLNYTLEPVQRDAILDTLVEKYLDEDEWFERYYMNEDEIRDLHAKGQSVGSHSHLHNLLADMSYDEQYEQISTSQKILSDVLGEKVDTFCYPYGGVRSYNEETKQILQELGFRIAFAVEKSENEDIFSISRRDCNEFMEVGE